MNRKPWFAPIVVIVLCLLTSGCFSIEQEIFLESDGSGDLVAYISMPDIPEAIKKNVPPSQPNSLNLVNIDDVKQKIANELPPTIKLKDAKEIQRHGAFAYYVVLHFDRLEDINSWLGKFYKETFAKQGQAQPLDSKTQSFWDIKLEKAGDRTVISQSFYTNLMEGLDELSRDAPGMDKPSGDKASSEPSPSSEKPVSAAPKPAGGRSSRRTARSANPAAPKEENPFESMADGLTKGLMNEEMITLLVSSTFKLRFVLHTPKKIAETNADIVLNGNIAVWNASFGAFIKDKKPIEMKVTY